MISVCYVVLINRILLFVGLVVGQLGMLRNCITDVRLGGTGCDIVHVGGAEGMKTFHGGSISFLCRGG